MAEIEIQRKKTPIWPWILGALVVVALLWFLVNRTGQPSPDQATTATTNAPRVTAPATDPTAPLLPEVQQFVTFVRDNEPSEDMGLQHEYTSNGIRNLADALNAIAQRTDNHNDRIDTKHQELHQMADQIQKNPTSTQHANVIRDAFTTSADMMERVQRNLYPHLENQVAEVRQAAQSINPQDLTLDQKNEVKRFFERAS
ncbi:hypothetical protein BH24BAC1_BH24BAC1_19590 [soil metagenome]